MSDISWVISNFHNSATIHGLVMNAEVLFTGLLWEKIVVLCLLPVTYSNFIMF
jgi:hypothetical protein